MTLEDRMAMNLGRLIIQVEQSRATIDDLVAKIAELEKQIVELKPKETE